VGPLHTSFRPNQTLTVFDRVHQPGNRMAVFGVELGFRTLISQHDNVCQYLTHYSLNSLTHEQ
jgi:hypothetical protein